MLAVASSAPRSDHKVIVKANAPIASETWRSNIKDANKWTGPRDASWFTKAALPKPGCSAPASLPLPTVHSTREQIREYFNNTWHLTEVLFSGLVGEEAFYRPPYHATRHPLIFYYCHVACLYINKLRVAGVLKEGINAEFEAIFETGVDEMSWDDLSKNEMEWPRVEEVIDYRRKTYEIVSRVIDSLDDQHTDLSMGTKNWALLLSFEHERIHLETSSVLMRELPVHLVRRPEGWPSVHDSAFASSSSSPSLSGAADESPVEGVSFPAMEFIEVVPDRPVTLGKPQDYPTFGWDNEYGSRTVRVPAFHAGSTKVTNGAFWQFVVAGGYRDDRYWSEVGIRWKAFRNVKWPTFWVLDGPQGLHKYKLRTIFEVIDMQWSWPAIVNLHEAEAFCAWYKEARGIAGDVRITAEAEHHFLDKALYAPSASLRDAEYRDVVTAPKAVTLSQHSNLNLAFGSETPVQLFAPSAEGFYDVKGNVWEWTQDHFNPLDGFRVHPFYDDFSTPCFDGKHNVIMGGSFVSTGDEASAFARFHFRPHFYQHAGFRVVISQNPSPAFHFPDVAAPETGELSLASVIASSIPFTVESRSRAPVLAALAAQKSWASSIEELVIAHASPAQRGSVLDVGCGVGGVTLALAKHFREVVGVDIDLDYITAAKALLKNGEVDFTLRTDGIHTVRGTAKVSLSPEERERVLFRQMDASCLAADFAPFDAVLLLDILSCSVSPKGVLSRMCGPRGLVKPKGGLLFVSDTWNWHEPRNPMGTWLGGEKEDGPSSFDVLKEFLEEEGFKLLLNTNMFRPVVISARDMRLSLPQVCVFQRL